MSRSKKSKTESKELTPELVILQRRKLLYNQDEVISFVSRLLFMIILFVILFGIVFGISPVRNNDMSPRMSSGDLLLFYRLEDTIHNQDVLIFEKEGEQYIGRVVARGGDTVEITESSELKINGSVVLENDIYYSTPQYEDGITFPVTLESDEYFILCDYREGAKDSRYFGAVSAEEITGKVITVIRRSGL